MFNSRLTTEVCQFDTYRFQLEDQDIAGSQVAVYDAMLMQKGHRL